MHHLSNVSTVLKGVSARTVVTSVWTAGSKTSGLFSQNGNLVANRLRPLRVLVDDDRAPFNTGHGEDISRAG